MNIIHHPDNVVEVKQFLNHTDCQALIQIGDKLGYDEAAINTGQGQEVFKGIRNNERILIDHPTLAKDLFKAAKPFLPEKFDNWQLKGFNERFRFYRYQPKQYFKWHRDGEFCRSENETSKFTLLIYLNDDYTGGETQFREFAVSPTEGMALLFPHPLMHQGATVKTGVKYVLRTDVMFTRLP